MVKLSLLFITVFSLTVQLSPPNSDTTDTIVPVIDSICNEEYMKQQREMEFFLNEIMKAFNITPPNKDTLNHK